MMKCIVHYFELAKKAIYETAKRPDRINYAFLKSQTSAQMNKLKQMKFEDPKGSRQEIQGYFTDFIDEINNAFKKLMDR
jgi:V-type H+-transporting ATPase subunit A